MAGVNIVASNGAVVIKKIGINQNLYDWFMASPFMSKVGSDGLKFYHKNYPASSLFAIPMTLGQLNNAQTNTLTAPVKEHLSNLITQAIQGLQEHELAGESVKVGQGAMAILKGTKSPGLVLDVGQDDAPDSLPGGAAMKHPMEKVINTVAKTAPNVKLIEKVTQVSVAETGLPNFPFDQLWEAPAIKLRDAKMMYQPVTASSPGSRYFVVAATHDLRIAARYKGGTLSIRIEGDGYDKIKPLLASNGIDGVQPSYASVHLLVQDEALARKTLSAILGGLNLSYITPIPNLAVFAEK